MNMKQSPTVGAQMSRHSIHRVDSGLLPQKRELSALFLKDIEGDVVTSTTTRSTTGHDAVAGEPEGGMVEVAFPRHGTFSGCSTVITQYHTAIFSILASHEKNLTHERFS